MKDYSQHGEQAIILEALSGSLGRFLDIGGFNAFDLSNTRALYELGWNGVIVEPSPGPMHGLIEAYGEDPRIQLVQAFIIPKLGRPAGLVKIHVSDDALSTSVEACFEKFSKHYKFLGHLWVIELAVTDLFLKFGEFDFVNIDTEGQSVELFRHMMISYNCPKLICVEHEMDSDNTNLQNLDLWGRERHYERVWWNACNAIYKRA